MMTIEHAKFGRVHELRPQDGQTNVVFCKYAMSHFEAWADEEHVYSITRDVAAELVSLHDSFANVDLTDHDGVLDDAVDISMMFSKELTASPLVEFRVVNFNPKRRKVFVTASNALRTDHVAISLYDIIGNSSSQRSLAVRSDEAFCKTIRLLNQTTFTKMGMKRLKK